MHNAMNGKVQPCRIGRRTVLQLLGSTGLAFVSIPIVGGKALAADDLLVFDWGGYDVPELHRPTSRSTAPRRPSRCSRDDEEAYSRSRRLSGRSRPSDQLRDRRAIATGHAEADRHIAADQLARRDAATRNVAGMATDGNQWLVPCGWGYNSVLYRSDLVEIEEESWGLLLDERYEGGISASPRWTATVIPAAMNSASPIPST